MMLNASDTVPGEMLSDAFNDLGSYFPPSIVIDVMLWDVVWYSQEKMSLSKQGQKDDDLI